MTLAVSVVIHTQAHMAEQDATSVMASLSLEQPASLALSNALAVWMQRLKLVNDQQHQVDLSELAPVMYSNWEMCETALHVLSRQRFVIEVRCRVASHCCKC
jgi:hypothetical protein